MLAQLAASAGGGEDAFGGSAGSCPATASLAAADDRSARAPKRKGARPFRMPCAQPRTQRTGARGLWPVHQRPEKRAHPPRRPRWPVLPSCRASIWASAHSGDKAATRISATDAAAARGGVARSTARAHHGTSAQAGRTHALGRMRSRGGRSTTAEWPRSWRTCATAVLRHSSMSRRGAGFAPRAELPWLPARPRRSRRVGRTEAARSRARAAPASPVSCWPPREGLSVPPRPLHRPQARRAGSSWHCRQLLARPRVRARRPTAQRAAPAPPRRRESACAAAACVRAVIGEREERTGGQRA